MSLGEEIGQLVEEQAKTVKTMGELRQENAELAYREEQLFALAGMRS